MASLDLFFNLKGPAEMETEHVSIPTVSWLQALSRAQMKSPTFKITLKNFRNPNFGLKRISD